MSNKFWHLKGPTSTSKSAEWVNNEIINEKIICPMNDGHRRGGKRLSDLSVTLPGMPIEDFVWTWYSECLIQDHVLRALEAEKFTGFEVKPVKARLKKETEKRPPRLWELIVTGWAGVTPAASGIKLIEHCQACRHMLYSGLTNPDKLIDERQWDGSDFFIVWPMPKFVFITDKVVQFIKKQRWKGYMIEELDDLRSDGFSPGRLSYWMPEARARQLGEPLGIY